MFRFTHRWVVGALIVFLVAMIAFTGINCIGNPSKVVASHVVQGAARVAILPMSDRVGVDLPWDVTQELMDGIRKKTGIDFVPNERVSGDYDYLVQLELIGYKEQKARGDLRELAMDVKVHIIEIQDGEPKVIREEVVQSRQLIPNGDELIDYSDVNWQSKDYLHTPKAVAHHRLSRDIADKVEQLFA